MHRSPQEDNLKHAYREMIDRARKQGFGGVLYRASHLRAHVGMTQLNIRSGRQLRIVKAGNGALAADVGKFWFVESYSTPDGPDIVPSA